MMKTLRRTFIALIVLTVWGALALPAWATTPARQASGPRTITGSYLSTSPVFASIGADFGIVLYDMTGEVTRDFDFQSPPEDQVLGTAQGDITSGTYTLTLPETPQGDWHDFDGDPASAPAVQVFATGTYINFLGDQYINRGESPQSISAQIEPMTYDVIGGRVLVWSAREGEKFPGSLGSDGAVFTADDPLLTLPAGWSVIALDTDPFTIIRDETVDVPIIESFGKLYDYSNMTYQEAWETLFQRTKVTYPFTAEKRLDWDAIYATITPMVEAAKTDLDFHLIMIHFGELIPDTHIGFVSMPVLQQYLLGGVGIGRLAVTNDDEVLISKVTPSSAADDAGIQAGDVLITVDGTPALEALDRTPMLLGSASTVQVRRFMQGAIMLQGPLGSAIKLTWRDAGGQEHTQTLARAPDMTAILDAYGGAISGEVVSGRLLDSGVGYIRVRSFMEDVSQDDARFTQELQALLDQGAKGIILDARDNSGGITELASSMAGHFFTDNTRLFDVYYADGSGGFAYRGHEEIIPNLPYYDGPVAVLVNEMTISAGDLFAYTMQVDHRAIVVGFTASSGSVGEVADGQYLLPGNLQAQIPTGRPLDPVTGQTILEGVGVIPDVWVPLTREALLSPEDEVLQAAEQAILGQ